MLIRVLVGLDDVALRKQIVAVLHELRVHVVAAGARPAHEWVADHRTDIVVVDVNATEIEPAESWLGEVAGLSDRPRVLVCVRSPDPELGARLLAAGASAVLDAGVEPDLMVAALRGAIEQCSVGGSLSVDAHLPRSEPLLWTSTAMQTVMDTVGRIALADSSVMLLGETGVGKERVAQEIHRRSHRNRGPFLAVNCAAIPAELFESELFGHERGAFTGAHRARRGLFELAHRGTLFLDEIGEVAPAHQAKLLRALQDRQIRPLGSSSLVDVDVRIIAATHRDLAHAIQKGDFRPDLYYRLAVVELTVPPLRERPEDIPLLANAFVDRFSEALGRDVRGISPSAMKALVRYRWLGNVRELLNIIERAVLLTDSRELSLPDLPGSIAVYEVLRDPPIAIDPTSTTAVDQNMVVELPLAWRGQPWKVVREGILLAGERAYLEAVLMETSGRIGQAAAHAGMSTRALFEKLRRHGLRKEDYRGGKA